MTLPTYLKLSTEMLPHLVAFLSIWFSDHWLCQSQEKARFTLTQPSSALWWRYNWSLVWPANTQFCNSWLMWEDHKRTWTRQSKGIRHPLEHLSATKSPYGSPAHWVAEALSGVATQLRDFWLQKTFQHEVLSYKEHWGRCCPLCNSWGVPPDSRGEKWYRPSTQTHKYKLVIWR